MKKVSIMLLIITILCGCHENAKATIHKQEIKNIGEKEIEKQMLDIQIVIQQQKYIAKFYDTPTTRQIIAMFPLTITMEDLNNNEKYYYFNQSLPTKVENIKEIHSGDILLFQQNCLVLFYQDFPTTYNYTKIGYLENPNEIIKVIDNKSVEVQFQIREE